MDNYEKGGGAITSWANYTENQFGVEGGPTTAVDTEQFRNVQDSERYGIRYTSQKIQKILCVQVRDCHAEGLPLAGSPVPGHPGAAGEGHHPDALQQVVEEYGGCLYQTGHSFYFYNI